MQIKKIILLFLFATLISSNVYSTINYPSQYDTTRYILIMYQTSTTTTLSADITSRSQTSITLTDATGFSNPGYLYFPNTGELMRISSVSGNTVTVTRDPRYNAGSGRWTYTSGEPVTFAHMQWKTGDSSIQLFQNNAKQGDFFIVSSHYHHHIFESIDFKLSTVATYTNAEIGVYEINFLTSSGGNSEYYTKRHPIQFEDGTNGFQNNGTISWHAHQTVLSYGYNAPIDFYGYMYDESGAYTNAFPILIKLENVSSMTTGPVMDNSNSMFYENVYRPKNEDDLTWETIYQSDLTTPLALGNEKGLFRQIVNDDEKSLQLEANVTSFTSAGNITIDGLTYDEDMYAYFPFYEGKGWVVNDLANNRERMAYPSVEVPIGGGYTNHVSWVNGQFSGKKALDDDGSSYTMGYVNIGKEYSALSTPFTIAVVYKARSTSGGELFSVSTGDPASERPQPINVYLTSGKVYGRTRDSANTVYQYVSTATDTNWHDVIITVTDSEMKLYYDGSLAATTSINGVLLTKNVRFHSGGVANGAYYNGSISEVGIWKHAFNSTEASGLHNKVQTEYMLEETDVIPITATGQYLSQTKFAHILNLSYEGDFDFDLYQPRLNVMRKTPTGYIFYEGFGLEYSNLTDTSRSIIEFGTVGDFTPRPFNNYYSYKDEFILGKEVDSKGAHGGTLVFWNPNAQGTYRSYIRGTFYGTKFELSLNSVEFAGADLKGVKIYSTPSHTGVFNTYNAYDLTNCSDMETYGVQAWLYGSYPFYDKNTLQVNPDENYEAYATSSRALYGFYYQGGFRKGVKARTTDTAYTDAYFYHYNWKEVVVNPDFNTIYVYPRGNYYSQFDMYGSPTFGYTYKLKVIDDNGNPVEGAKVYLKDKNGYSAIFTPPAYVYPTTWTLYGDNYGTKKTHFAVNDASSLSIGDVIDLFGERMKITNIIGNEVYIDRAVQNSFAYTVYTSRTTNAFITKQHDYLITNASGEIPELIIYTDFYKHWNDISGTGDKYTLNPFTLKIIKNGYEPIDTIFNLTKKTEETKVINGKRGLHPININIVSSTHYYPTDYVDVEVKAEDEYGQPVTNASCTFDVYYPDKSIWLSGISTSQIGSTGVYYNNTYQAPNVLGVYTYIANCSYDNYSVLDMKTMEVIQQGNASGSDTSYTTIEKPGTTVYTCSDNNTLLKNTTYDDGTYKLIYTPCEHGCYDGSCLDSTQQISYLKILIVSIAILLIISLFVMNKTENVTFKNLIFFFILFLLIVLLISIGGVGNQIGESIGNVLTYVGYIIGLIFLFTFSMFAWEYIKYALKQKDN